MLCTTCKQKVDCLPAALAANDTHMYKLLARLKECDRYVQESPKLAPRLDAFRRRLFTRSLHLTTD